MIKKPEKYEKPRHATNAQVREFADMIIENLSIKTIKKHKTIWMFSAKHKCYRPEGEQNVETLCSNNILFNTPAELNKVLMNVRGSTYIDTEEFESPAGYVNLSNGVFDLLELTLLETGPKYNFKYTLPIEYDRFATCPIFEKVVRDMTLNEKDYHLMQKWTGYQFFKSPFEQKSMFLVGPPETGKGIYAWALQQLMGIGNFTAHSLQSLSQLNLYFIADLYGKAANICEDMSSDALKDVSLFKQLTGDGYVSGRSVRKEPITFKNYAKSTFICNELPYLHENIAKDMAFWRRIILVETKKGFDKKDKLLKDKLAEELPGIFNWAIDGFIDVLNEGFPEDDAPDYAVTRFKWISHMVQPKYQRVPDESVLTFPPPTKNTTPIPDKAATSDKEQSEKH